MILKPTDRFRTANLTELFTAVLCLQLVETGELELDEPIATYLPDDAIAKLGICSASKDQAWGRLSLEAFESITVRQLLNHTSGLADLQPDALKQVAAKTPAKHIWTAKELLDFLPDRPSQRQVNEPTHAATNYLLLQIILEQVTGQPLAETLTRSHRATAEAEQYVSGESEAYSQLALVRAILSRDIRIGIMTASWRT